jgi:hypothetical protein
MGAQHVGQVGDGREEALVVFVFFFPVGLISACAAPCAVGDVSPTPATGRDFISTVLSGPGSEGVCCAAADTATGAVVGVEAAF